jgi:predicted  nucleic acid-binding Zn-ribbon protein
MPISGNDPLNLLKPEAGELVSLSVINTNYDTINTYADENDTRVAAIESVNTSQGSRLDEAEADLLGLDSRLDTIEGQALDTRLTTAEGEIDTLQSESTDYDNRISALEADTLDARVDVLEGQNLDSRLDTIEALNVSARLTTAENEINAIEALDIQQNQRLAVLEIAAGNPPINFSVDGGTP